MLPGPVTERSSGRQRLPAIMRRSTRGGFSRGQHPEHGPPRAALLDGPTDRVHRHARTSGAHSAEGHCYWSRNPNRCRKRGQKEHARARKRANDAPCSRRPVLCRIPGFDILHRFFLLLYQHLEAMANLSHNGLELRRLRRSQLSRNLLQMITEFGMFQPLAELYESRYRNIRQPGQTIILKRSKNIQLRRVAERVILSPGPHLRLEP